MSTRDEFIRSLRELADFLTVNPDVPTPPLSEDITLHAHGTDEEQMAELDAFAAALDVPVTSSGGTHFRATVHFGSLRYRMVAITHQAMDDYHERNRLGREAFERLRAERDANTVDGEVVEAAEIARPVPAIGGAR